MPRENPREALVTMPQRLTPDVAKEALIALVRSRDAGNLCNLPLDKLANVPPEKDEEGKFVWWGPIKVDLEGRKYRYARGSGLGKALLAHLAGLALERGCARLEWSVLDWNEPAIGFYRSLGARMMDEWTVMRVEGAALAQLGAANSRSAA